MLIVFKKSKFKWLYHVLSCFFHSGINRDKYECVRPALTGQRYRLLLVGWWVSKTVVSILRTDQRFLGRWEGSVLQQHRDCGRRDSDSWCAGGDEWP